MKFKFLFSILIASQFQSGTSWAGKEGNGAGGFCVKGKCITLAEAGIQMKDAPYQAEGYSLDVSLVKKIVAVEALLPWNQGQQSSIERFLGKEETFQLVELLDPAKFEIAKREYTAFLKNHAPAMKPEDLIFYAFSDERYTYLLPDFFTQLNLSQQANVIRHELYVRQGKNLEDILRLDIELLAYEHAIQSGASSDPFNLAYAFYKVGDLDESILSALAIDKIERQNGIVLDAKVMCAQDASVLGLLTHEEHCKPTREWILSLATIDPALPYVLGNIVLYKVGESALGGVELLFNNSVADISRKCATASPGAKVMVGVKLKGFTTVGYYSCKNEAVQQNVISSISFKFVAAQNRIDYFVHRVIEGINYQALYAGTRQR